MTLDASNYLRTKRGTEFVTEIQADGNVNLAAGNDLNARAANVASKNADISLTAGNDVNITAGTETAEDHYAMRYKERGLFSSKTTTIRTDSEERSALSANISGKNPYLRGKRCRAPGGKRHRRRQCKRLCNAEPDLKLRRELCTARSLQGGQEIRHLQFGWTRLYHRHTAHEDRS